MPYNLKDRKVLVTAGTRGLGAAISRKFMEQGCRIAINYVSSEERAIATAKELESDFGRRVLILKGDMGVADECETVVKKAAEALGGLDVLISNAVSGRLAFNPNSVPQDLFALSEEEWDKCWAVNVKGNMFLFRAAMPILNSNPEGGCFIMTSSVAAIALSGSAMAYSVTKAAQVHLMKCLAQHQGSKIRTNAVLPGLLLTEWVDLQAVSFNMIAS
ncbi:MAG: hypothetical protein M1814_004670 [Vezdaea aestivalis]|nr:MAG: hypothetical protein M1814_004670 [Vezdaea aestivalis]